MKDATSRVKDIALLLFFLFLFFLPLYEAPKNIFSVLFIFIGGWIAYHQHAVARFKSKDFIVWVCLLLAISPLMAGLDSPYMNTFERLKSALNWAVMPLIMLVILLIGFSKEHLLWAYRVICLGTSVATIEAMISRTGSVPELNSVGHVNQSALYLAFSLIPALVLLISSKKNIFDWVLSLGTIWLIAWFQAPAKSLIAAITCVLIATSFIGLICARRFTPLMLAVCILIGGGAAYWVIKLEPAHFGVYAGLKSEFDDRLSSDTDPFSKRDRLVKTSIAVAKDSAFGFGLSSFGRATQVDELQRIVVQNNSVWTLEKDKYFSSSHGHNLFANVLVERGWFGVSVFAVFFVVVIYRLSLKWMTTDAQVGLVSILVALTAGLGQSTFHVEHGQLIFCILGMQLASLEVVGSEIGCRGLAAPEDRQVIQKNSSI